MYYELYMTRSIENAYLSFLPNHYYYFFKTMFSLEKYSDWFYGPNIWWLVLFVVQVLQLLLVMLTFPKFFHFLVSYSLFLTTNNYVTLCIIRLQYKESLNLKRVIKIGEKQRQCIECFLSTKCIFEEMF